MQYFKKHNGKPLHDRERVAGQVSEDIGICLAVVGISGGPCASLGFPGYFGGILGVFWESLGGL